MTSISLPGITSVAQWLLFAGIALILFGWFEKKDKTLLAGQIIFLLLGLLAIWVLISERTDIVETIGKNTGKEMKILSFYKGILILTGMDFVSLLLKLFKLRFQKASNAIVILVALMLFFMVFNILKMPA